MFDHLTNPTLISEMHRDYTEYSKSFINKFAGWQKWIRT